MRQRTPSPPLITGIDGIVSRPPNEVNYSALNGKNMETRKQPDNERQRKYKKQRISEKMTNYVKQDKNDGNTRILNQRGKGNETELIENKVEDDGGDDGATRAPKRRKYGNSKPNTDSTNDNICNNSTSAGRNIDNGSEKLINTETDTITTNDEGNKGEEEEVEAEAEADANSKIPNKSNGIGSGNSESSSNTVITLQLLEE